MPKRMERTRRHALYIRQKCRPAAGDSVHNHKGVNDSHQMSDANSLNCLKEVPGSTWPAGKDRRLEALSAAPLVLQTPLSLLAGKRITDKQILFVRNCQDIGGGVTVEPRPLDRAAIELAGLISPASVVIRADDLVGMPQIEYEMVLQCAGNGRSRYAGVPARRGNRAA